MSEESEEQSVNLDFPVVSDPSWIPPPVPSQVAERLPNRRHSKLGIVAFILSLLCGSMILGEMVLSGIIRHSAIGYHPQAFIFWMQIIGYGIIFVLAVDLLALGLGIGGLCQPRTNRLFAVLGVVLSFGGMVLFFLLVIIGMVIKGQL